MNMVYRPCLAASNKSVTLASLGPHYFICDKALFIYDIASAYKSSQMNNYI